MPHDLDSCFALPIADSLDHKYPQLRYCAADLANFVQLEVQIVLHDWIFNGVTYVIIIVTST